MIMVSRAGSGSAASTSSTASPWRASLASPMPLIRPSSASVARAPGGDLPQRRVVEDHVRRARPAPCAAAAAPGPQPLEHRRGVGGQLGRGRGCAARGRRGARAAFVGLPPQQHRRARRAAPRALRVGERERAVARPRRASRPWASSCRTTPRHSASRQLGADAEHATARRGRTASTLSVVRLPSRMSIDLPGAEPLVALAVAAGSTVDSSFCAATVPSQDSRRRQAGVAVAARRASARRSRPAAAPGGTRRSRTARASRRGARPACAGASRSPSEVVDHACAAARRPAARRPARPSTAGRRGRPGRSPGSSPRPTSAGRGGRRTARRACRCPCRTRSSRP